MTDLDTFRRVWQSFSREGARDLDLRLLLAPPRAGAPLEDLLRLWRKERDARLHELAVRRAAGSVT